MIEIKKMGRDIVFWYIIFFIALSFFTIFSLARIGQTVAQDELHFLVAGKTLYTEGLARRYYNRNLIMDDDPHLYVHTIALAFRFFGDKENIARLPGIFSGLLTIIMVFFVTKSFSHGNRRERIQWAALSSLLYASMPVLIQGSVIMNIDSTVLVPAVLFLCWSFARYQEEFNMRCAFLTGLATFTALWARLTIPTVVTIFLLFYVLADKKHPNRKLILIGPILFGYLLFAVSWYLYCNAAGITCYKPFIRLLSCFQNNIRISFFQVTRLLKESLVLILWIGIFQSLLFIIAAIQGCQGYVKKREIKPEDIFLCCGVIIVIVTSAFGGITFGYPKYHSPAFPLLCISVGLALSRSKIFFADNRFKASAVTILFIAFALQKLILGDLLYVVRYTLREAIAFMLPLYPVLKEIALKILVYITFSLIIAVIYLKGMFRKTWLLLFVLFSIGANIGTAFLQNSADYRTGNSYGERGMIKAVEHIHNKVSPQSTVLASAEIIYHLNFPGHLYWPSLLWTDKVRLKRRLADKNTSALVYSITTNTIEQIRTMSADKDIQEILRQSFNKTIIEDYIVWIRK